MKIDNLTVQFAPNRTQMEKILEMAREDILSNRYGKFDFVETIFPLNVLLNTRPRLLRKMICDKLELQPNQINYKTFISWRSRFIKKYRRKPAIKQTSDEKDSMDWRNHQPPEPIPEIKRAVIRLVKSGPENNEK